MRCIENDLQARGNQLSAVFEEGAPTTILTLAFISVDVALCAFSVQTTSSAPRVLLRNVLFSLSILEHTLVLFYQLLRADTVGHSVLAPHVPPVARRHVQNVPFSVADSLHRQTRTRNGHHPVRVSALPFEVLSHFLSLILLALLFCHANSVSHTYRAASLYTCALDTLPAPGICLFLALSMRHFLSSALQIGPS